MRKDAEKIYTGAINACLPDTAVLDALSDFKMPSGRLVLVAIGKAAWRMARAASDAIIEKGEKIDTGAVITKYGHSEGDIPNLEIYEAGHPVPDENGRKATARVLEMTSGLTEDDTVLFLVSGGGSALFELTACSLDELRCLTSALLSSGADIYDINAIRKHLSLVKGGRFAEHIYPASVFSIALSDVVGNRLDVIASGPCAPDTGTVKDVENIIKKYNISVPEHIKKTLMVETPKQVANAEHRIGGSVSELCRAAEKIAKELGYKTEMITDTECGIARDVGSMLAALAHEKCHTDTPLAYIIGGETVVRVLGGGLGGRNQEIALSAAIGIEGLTNVSVFSVGSDGTDGPTDAAGGYVDGNTARRMREAGIDPVLSLENNDSYHALERVGGLIKTGPTGTNVNDVALLLIRKEKDINT